MPAFTIRTYGDPVLRTCTPELTEIDGTVATLVDGMIETLYAAGGLGLAATQVGVEKRLFVYDLNDETGPHTVINPTIVEQDGEWTYDEGCLSVPGLYFTIVRPRRILLAGLDLDGNDVRLEAEDLEARLFQHEFDHLDGTLLLEHLQPPQRKAGLRVLRERQVSPARGEPIVIGPDGEVVPD